MFNGEVVYKSIETCLLYLWWTFVQRRTVFSFYSGYEFSFNKRVPVKEYYLRV